MTTRVATLIDFLRRRSAQVTGQGMALIAGAVRGTFTDTASSDKDERSERVCWCIVVAVVVGAPFVDASVVFRDAREFAELASGLF